MTDQTETPAATLEAATLRNALPDARLTLLGTVQGPSHARAIVRVGSTVHTVEVGTRIGKATVATIGEGVVILTRGAQHERLSLPAS